MTTTTVALTAMTDEAFDKHYEGLVDTVSTLASQVVSEVISNEPLDQSLPRWQREHAATPFGEIAVGDVLAVVNLHKRRGAYFRPYFLAEGSLVDLVAHHSVSLVVVTKRTSARLTMVTVSNPAAWAFNDFDLAYDEATSFPQVLGESAGRHLISLGSHADLVARFKAAPSYSTWEREHAALLQARDEDNRRRALATAQVESVQAPKRELTKRLNAALGLTAFLFVSYEEGYLTRYADFKALNEEMLRTMLAGRVAVGAITSEEYDWANQALRSALAQVQ